MSKHDEQADQLATVMDIVKDVAELAGAVVPFVAPLVKVIDHAARHQTAKRLNMLFLVATNANEKFQPEDPDVVEAVKAFTGSGENILPIVKRLLGADEEEKVFLFGALLGAFARNEVKDVTERLRMLRFADDIVGEDLGKFLEFATESLRYALHTHRDNVEPGEDAPAIEQDHPIALSLRQTGLMPRPDGFTFVNMPTDYMTILPKEDTAAHRLFTIAADALRARERLEASFRKL
ncbi:MAG: hypothetical protein Q8O67_17090 [Deltaproteobacteria bacterium]|nr:hypothetical protein [Deltaproteobacteria bacterium]